MVLELLWIEVVLKAAAGVLLVAFPRTLARLLGLAPVAETFWPRLLGATLLGLAVATFLEGQLATKNGLGMAGHVALNLSAAMAIVALMIVGRAAPTRRGRALLGAAAAALTLLALVELAWV
ncbi:MAG: ABC transporter permease [Hyphomicrobiaceae bacterium]|nr:ABC transporter permease [Hyphomicrobiaceae bacterium]